MALPPKLAALLERTDRLLDKLYVSQTVNDPKGNPKQLTFPDIYFRTAIAGADYVDEKIAGATGTTQALQSTGAAIPTTTMAVPGMTHVYPNGEIDLIANNGTTTVAIQIA